MNKMTALFIDDDDISSIIGRLERLLGKKGITLIPSVIDIKKEGFRSASKEDPNITVLDFDKIKDELKSKYLNVRFDLVACDFNFSDKGINGFKLIKWFKNYAKGQKSSIRNAKFVLYSSERGKSLKEAFDEDDMGDLVRLKLEDFIDRTKVSEELANILLNTTAEINLSKKLISEMEKFKQLEFKSVYPKFKGKKLEEIIFEIEKESHHGIAFQDNLIELSVSHMIDLNK